MNANMKPNSNSNDAGISKLVRELNIAINHHGLVKGDEGPGLNPLWVEG